MPQRETHHAHDGPHKDRWHYLDYRDGKHDENFVEWKYFNFVQDDLAGYIMYHLLDPEKKSRLGGARLLVRIFKDGKLFGTIKHIDMERVQLDQLSASAVFDQAEIVEHDPHHYDIIGNFEDVSWQLSYRQKTPTIDSFSGIHPKGFMSWVRASWLIKMPSAEVSGAVQIGKDAFFINGIGYSDSDWGEFLPFLSHYEWGQFNDGRLSLVFGILLGLEKIKYASFYFALGDQIIPLENAKCSIDHMTWSRDKNSGIKIPSHSKFAIRKDDYLIEFTSDLIQSDTPGIQINKLLPKIAISEQLVKYSGIIEKGGERLYEFRGNGFQEWSTRTWKNIAAPF